MAPRSIGLLCALLPAVQGCTNILVSPHATADGAAIVAANDDSAARHGLVTHFPAAEHAEGDVRAVYHFETGKLQGYIPEPRRTYNVMAHGNEMGLVIGESTHGGLSELNQNGKDHLNGTILDYGSLIYVTLQRAATAREAILTIADLANTYGYASSMEGFSITDGEEVWYMELIGKGDYSPGIVWVALRVPDGYITAHANQARITTYLPCDDPNWCMAAPDAVTFAIEHGLYSGTADDMSFSFSDTYDPPTPSGARSCEARVWYIFSQLADPEDFNPAHYLSYAQGYNLTNRMPLFVRARGKLERNDIHAMLSHHFEGSWFDTELDVGAGAEHSPYRWNGLSWKADGVSYVNERVVGTQYTAWHHVALVRNSSVPRQMRAVSWFGSDDHTWAPKVPLHGGATAVHRTYDDGNCSARLACRRELGLPGSMMDFSWESAFWVNSVVADVVYSRMDRAAPIVREARGCFDSWALERQSVAEEAAGKLFAQGDEAGAIEVLTGLAVEATQEATARWTALWQDLVVRTIDGKSAQRDDSNLMCGCKKSSVEYSEDWNKKVVADTGDHYRRPDEDCTYIDADGHCHHDSPPGAAPVHKAIPKSEFVDGSPHRSAERHRSPTAPSEPEELVSFSV